jgi:hypothetical protein
MRRLFVIAMIVTACGGTAPTLSPSPPAAVVTAAPTVSPTSRSTAQTASQKIAAHITASVTRLENLVGNDAIAGWVFVEGKWLDTQPNLPIVRPYLLALTQALADATFVTTDTDLSANVTDIISAARQVPGATLP